MTTLMPIETAVCISKATSGTKWNEGFHAGQFALISIVRPNRLSHPKLVPLAEPMLLLKNKSTKTQAI